MSTNRLEAFSDGVLAIIITIMVLEMKVPKGADVATLTPMIPLFVSYVLSFAYVAIYWNNHHHLFAAARSMDASVMWANMHLLFWLSLIPFVTGWMGENDFAAVPTALYGVVLLAAAIAYRVLQWRILALEPEGSLLHRALDLDIKGRASPLLYLAAIGLAQYWPWLSCAIYAAVALLWIVPDHRIERILSDRAPS